MAIFTIYNLERTSLKFVAYHDQYARRDIYKTVTILIIIYL